MHKFIRLIVVGAIFILTTTGFRGIHAQSFTITDSTETSIELTFSTSSSGVLVLVSSDASFSSPVDGTTYNAGNNIGSDEVVYVGATSTHTHASLTSGTHYYYRAWEFDGSNNYTLIDSDDAFTLKYEPTYHVTGFSATANDAEQITLSWTDAIGTVLPDRYLVKASTVSYADISAPVDGNEETDAALVKNIDQGTQSAVFTGLSANTTYYFEIYPYTNKGADINYKTYAGTLPQASVTTDYSSSSDLVEQSGFTYTQDIDYSGNVGADVTSSSTTLWALTIRDGGASTDDDNASTTLQNLTFSVSNASLLNSIAIYDGNTEIQEVPASATVSFTGLGLEASDDGTKDFLIKATFNTTVTDNQIVSFSVSGADVTSASSASSFANFSTLSSSTSSPDNQIEVDATKLVISSYDSPVDVNTNFGFSVEARDANENVDLDESTSVTLGVTSGDGTLSSTTGTSQSLSSGIYSWSDLQYDVEQTFEITASATGLTSASQSINVNSSSDSEADAPATQVASTTISSLDDTDAEAVNVFKFDITDNGSGNGFVTDVTRIRLKPGSSNNIDWTDHIQGVTIDDGASVSPASVNITDSYIDINLTSGTIQVTDGSSTEITIGVYLNSSNITDNGVLQMMIDSDAHGFTADASGSGFASSFSGDVVSNTHTVEVEATELNIIEQPTDVYTAHVMSPSVTVEAIDANGNRDLDYVSDMSLASSGPTLSGTNTATPVSGLGTFDNIQFSDAGAGATLTISSGTLTDDVSSSFDVTLSVPEIEITHSSTTLNAADGSTDIDFGSVTWGSTATADLTIDNLGQADLTITTPVSDAGDFTVSSQPSSPVIEGGSTSMQISFTPSSAGAISNTITISNNDSDEGSFVLNLTGTGTLNATSDVVATTFDPTDNIDYNSYQSTDISTDGAGTGNIKIGEFEIRDGGGSDADDQSTILTDLTFSVSNSANLNSLAIVDGGAVVDEAAAASSVSFSGMTLTAADDGSKTFEVYASFESSVTDNQQIQLTVTSVTAGSGSGFAAADGGGAATPVAGDDNRIEVDATTLNYLTYPASVDVSSNFTVALEAVDAHGNRDLDESSSISLATGITGSGAISHGASPNALSAGYAQWTDVQYDTEDNFTITATAGAPLSTSISGGVITTNRAEQTLAQDPASQIAGAAISTVNNDESTEMIDVFKFTVVDEGSGSGDATTLTKIRIKPGASNQVDWSDAIQGGRLNDGFITLSGVTVTDTYIDFNISGGNNTISDGGQLDITLSIYLNQNDKMIDGQTISFMVDADNHGWTDNGSGSALKSDFGTDVISNDFTIDVTATAMEFVTVPATVTVGDAFTVEVQPVDIHGNVDTDEATEATIALNSGSGSLYSADASNSFSSGVVSWTDLEYNVAETFNLQATHAGFSTITSSDITASSATAPNAPTVSTAYLADDQIQIDVSRPSGTYGTDWDGYVVFARELASNNADMTADDFSDFTASTSYSSGTADNNSYCVAKVSSDADLTATITVLTRNNDYYFEAFAVKEINGSGNDLWSSASAEVSANADVQGVSGLSASAGDAQASLNWTNYSGPQGIWWDEVVILAKKGSAVSATPTGDGSAYTANSVFTSGTGVGTGNYVVYKGTGNSATIIGLNNGEDYYFRVFVRRGTEWTDADHYQSTSLTPSGGSGNVIITEVTDYSFDDTKSYVELYNAGSSAVNLNGWELSQYNSDASLTLGNLTQQNTSADLILNPGEYALIVRSNWSGLKSEYGIADDVAMFTGASIPTINGSERYVLSDGLAKATQDVFGSTGTFSASDNSCYERNSIPSSDGTLESSWSESSNTSYGYTPAGENNNPLPVELIVFDVERDGKQVVLYWVTASEKNNSHFEVQRSLDADFYVQTDVIIGAGNSKQNIEYTCVDVPETNGLIYYRFKQVDYDGQYTYSPVRVVNMSSADQPLSMRNPWITENQLNTIVENTSEDQKLLLEIYNVSGQKVSERQFNAEENASHIRMQMPYGERGVYFLRIITAENQVLTKKFLY